MEKDDLKNVINEVFIDCIDKIKDDKWFFDNFAPAVNFLDEQVAADEREIMQMEEMKNNYMAWSKRVKEIDCSIL